MDGGNKSERVWKGRTKKYGKLRERRTRWNGEEGAYRR